MSLDWKIGDAFLNSEGQTFIIKEIESDDIHGGMFYLSAPVQGNDLYAFTDNEMLPCMDKANELSDLMIAVHCEKCDSTDCCERTDLPDEPILCDECFRKARKSLRMKLFPFVYGRPIFDKPLKTGRKSAKQFAMIDKDLQARVEKGRR